MSAVLFSKTFWILPREFSSPNGKWQVAECVQWHRPELLGQLCQLTHEGVTWGGRRYNVGNPLRIALVTFSAKKSSGSNEPLHSMNSS